MQAISSPAVDLPREGKYRLRVGSFRALFTMQADTIFVYAVEGRKEAYD